MTVNSTTTSYCYDNADRLISSSNDDTTNPQYGSRGNTNQYGTGATTSPYTYLVYDSSDRNLGLEQYTDQGDGFASYYERDTTNRITARWQYTAEDWDWQET